MAGKKWQGQCQSRRACVTDLSGTTSQLYLEGKVKQANLVKVFGVSAISIKRVVKL